MEPAHVLHQYSVLVFTSIHMSFYQMQFIGASRGIIYYVIIYVHTTARNSLKQLKQASKMDYSDSEGISMI